MRPFSPLACFILVLIAAVADRTACGQPPPIVSDLWINGGGAVGETARFTVQQTAAPSQPFAVAWSLAPPWHRSPPFFPAASGQLSASGRASFYLHVPNAPALQGVVLRLVAGVWVQTYGLSYSKSFLWPIAGPSTPVARPVGRLPASSRFATVAPLADGRFLISGGQGPSVTTLSSQVFTYDPNLNRLSTVGAMTTGRVWHVATPLSSGEVLIVGTDYPVTTAELYDTRSNRSTPVGSPMSWQFRPVEAVRLVDPVSRREWVFHSVWSSSALIYDAQGKRFTTANYGSTRGGYAIAALPGKPEVVMAGGFAGQSMTDGVVVYNAATGLFRAAGRMKQARVYAAALALDGRYVLIIGGDDKLSNELADVELFDTLTGVSLVLPVRLRVPRYGHVIGLDRTGHVRVCGGRGPVPVDLSTNILIEQLGLTASVPLRPLPWLGDNDILYTFGASRDLLAVAERDVFYIP